MNARRKIVFPELNKDQVNQLSKLDPLLGIAYAKLEYNKDKGIVSEEQPLGYEHHFSSYMGEEYLAKMKEIDQSLYEQARYEFECRKTLQEMKGETMEDFYRENREASEEAYKKYILEKKEENQKNEPIFKHDVYISIFSLIASLIGAAILSNAFKGFFTRTMGMPKSFYDVFSMGLTLLVSGYTFLVLANNKEKFAHIYKKYSRIVIICMAVCIIGSLLGDWAIQIIIIGIYSLIMLTILSNMESIARRLFIIFNGAGIGIITAYVVLAFISFQFRIWMKSELIYSKLDSLINVIFVIVPFFLGLYFTFKYSKVEKILKDEEKEHNEQEQMKIIIDAHKPKDWASKDDINKAFE